MRITTLLLWIVLLVPVAFAQSQVTFTLTDGSTNQQIDNVIVTYDLGVTHITDYVSKVQPSTVTLEPDADVVLISIDDPQTKGKDYYGKHHLTIQGRSEEMFVFPVGSVRGVVRDEQGGVAKNALLKFDCSGISLAPYPSHTDEFGSFTMEHVPVGHCNIHASFVNSAGMIELEMKQGDLKDVVLPLEAPLLVAPPNPLWWNLIFFGTLGFVIIVLWKRFGKPRRKHQKESSKVELSERGLHMLETLNDREKQIVAYLVEHQGRSSQSQIGYGTGLPKASIFRHVESLQAKKVIIVAKQGKAKSISLSSLMTKEEDEMEP